MDSLGWDWKRSLWRIGSVVFEDRFIKCLLGMFGNGDSIGC